MISPAAGSGSAPFLPTSISGCVLWLRADLGYTIDVGVDLWADQSGNGHSFIQATDANQPGYTAANADFNDQATVDFVAASAHRLVDASATVTANKAHTIAVVFKATTVTGHQVLLGSATGATGVFNCTSIVSPSRLAFYDGGTARPFLTSEVTTDLQDGIWVCDGDTDDTCHLYQSGLDRGTVANVGYAITGQMAIGALANGTTFPFDGSIAEVIIYDSLLTSPQIDALRSYIVARYHGNGYDIVINGQSNAWADQTNFTANPSAAAQEGTDLLGHGGFALGQGIADSGASDGAGGLGIGQFGARLGRLLLDSGQTAVRIISEADGGQAIAHFLPDAVDATPNNYQRMVDKVAVIRARPRAYVWWQGESDAIAGMSEEDYTAALETLYAAVAVDVPTLRRFVVVMIRSEACGATEAGSDAIRAAQVAFVATHAADVLATRLVDLDDLTTNPPYNGCHYHRDGYYEAAERVAAEIL